MVLVAGLSFLGAPLMAETVTVLSVDFDSLSAGGVTEATLDSATTGGTWATNTYSGGGQVLEHTIENDGGAGSEKALFSNFPGTGGADNPASMWVHRVDLDTALDIDVTGFTFEFEVAQRAGTGFSRPVTWSLNDGSTQVLRVQVSGSTLYVNGNNEGTVDGNPNGGVGSWDSSNTYVWLVEGSSDASGNVDLTFHGTTATQTVSVAISSTADINRFEGIMDADQWNGHGLYLNYLTLSYTKQPAAIFMIR